MRFAFLQLLLLVLALVNCDDKEVSLPLKLPVNKIRQIRSPLVDHDIEATSYHENNNDEKVQKVSPESPEIGKISGTLELQSKMKNIKTERATTTSLASTNNSNTTLVLASFHASKTRELYLPLNYNKLEIPKFQGAHLPVEVFIKIRSVPDFDELNEEITIDIDLTVGWIDGVLFENGVWKHDLAIFEKDADFSTDSDEEGKTSSLLGNQKTLNPVFLDDIWIPDLYFDNLIKVKQPILMTKPLRLRVSLETGLITYYARLTVKVRCNMNFVYYPADTQKCEFILKSYSYPSSELQLSWSEKGVYFQDPSHANFELAVGSVAMFKSIHDFEDSKKDTYDALQFIILARRKLSYHLLQTYLPSGLFIIITWLCFMIPPRMIEARIGIAMTTLLTLTAMFASVRGSTPVLSYIKAIDVWMVACIIFVFLTLFEFAVLLWIRFPKEEKDGGLSGDEEKNLLGARHFESKKFSNEANQDLNHLSIKFKNGTQGSTKGMGTSKKNRRSNSTEISSDRKFKSMLRTVVGVVERFVFSLFSLIFLSFTVLYWTWLLINAGYFKWHVDFKHNNPLIIAQFFNNIFKENRVNLTSIDPEEMI